MSDELPEWLLESIAKLGRAGDLIDEMVLLYSGNELADLLGYIEDTPEEIARLALTGAVARLVGWAEAYPDHDPADHLPERDPNQPELWETP